MLIQNRKILLLKNLAVLAQQLVSVFIVLAVFCHFVDEEQRKRLDAQFEKFLLFFKVRKDRFMDLHPAHIIFGNVTGNIAFADGIAVRKGHNARDRVDFRHYEALVLLHFPGDVIEIIAHIQRMELSLRAVLVADLQLHFCPWRILRGDDDAFQIQILVRTTQIFDLKAFDFDFLDQPLIISVQRIQNVDQIVLLGVGSRVIQCEKRIELFQGFLRGRVLFAHLLRFVQNQDRTVGGNHINRAAGAELVPLGVNNSRSGITLAAFHVLVLVHGCRKRLRVDDHDIDAGIAGKGIQLIQVAAVVDKEPCLFAVALHKVIGSDLKGLLYPLTDGDTRYNNDKFAPAIPLVQLEHGLDVNIGLACAGFHLNIQRTPAQRGNQLFRLMNIAFCLQCTNILHQICICQLQSFILEARIVDQILQLHLCCIVPIGNKAQLLRLCRQASHIPQVRHACIVGLALKDPCHRIHSIRLVLLNLKTKLHLCGLPPAPASGTGQNRFHTGDPE